MEAPAASIRIASYELFERLGEGGSGQVYRARSPDGVSVAVKLLGPAADLDPEAAHARFRREIETLGGVQHGALVSLVDHGVDDELGPYLVMPLIPGQTLRELIAAGIKLCPEAAVLLLEPVASAVAALHDRSLVHRDLKPENVMVTPEGRVVVVDLGLAWGPDMSRHTAEGTAVGSVPYMAPEQIEGSGVGTAADVWALGVMLYELIAGKRPFARARASEEAAAALVGAYAPLDAVDPRCAPELVQLVARCLDRAPLARPTAAMFAGELAGAIDWIDEADRGRDRAAVALAPTEFVSRVAPFRVRREKRLAREAIAAHRPFEALAHVDRALAYAPEDPELLSLADDAEAKSSRSGAPAPIVTAPVTPSLEVATPREPRPRRSSLTTIITVAVIAAGFAAVVSWIALRGSRKTDAPAETTRVAEHRDAGVVDAFTAVPRSGKRTSPVPGLFALDPRGIPNDLPGRIEEMRAPPGEHIFAQERLEEPDPAKAMASIDADVARTPDRKNRLAQAVIYLAAGRTDDGLAKLDRVLADFPDYADAWAAKGYVEVRRGNAREAEEAMTRAIELDPDDHESYRNRGILRDHQGRARDAYPDLMAALERDPTDVEAMAELAQIYSAAGHRDEARPLLERIVRLRPQNVTGWLDLSLMQPTPEAIESIEHALSLDPRNRRGNVRMCTVLAEAGDKEAVAQCTRAVQLAPDDPWAWMGRGLARYQLASDVKGLDDVDKAIAMKPDHAQFYVNRYILRSHAGMLAQAKADLSRACELGASEACTQLKK